jgi:hypothetical protein
MPRLAVAAGIAAALALSLTAQEPKKDDPKKAEPKAYKSGDRTRPRPKVVDPGDAPGKPPADAIILFDGKDLAAEWVRAGKKGDEAKPLWKVENGYAEIVPKGGAIQTVKRFGDCQLHVEWATPAEVKGSDQGRGNSGVKLGGFGEVQVLDSFGNDTYPDGQAAALYGKFPPLVNASRKPGEWQTFDIVAHLPKVDEAGKVVRPGRLTVLHNGVLVHHAVEFPGKIGEFNVFLQDHGNPVRYRNIWVRKLADYDADGTPPPEPKKK